MYNVPLKFVHVGFGTVLCATRIVAFMNPKVPAAKRYLNNAKKKGIFIDSTNGRRLRNIVIMDDGSVIGTPYSTGVMYRNLREAVDALTPMDVFKVPVEFRGIQPDAYDKQTEEREAMFQAQNNTSIPVRNPTEKDEGYDEVDEELMEAEESHNSQFRRFPLEALDGTVLHRNSAIAYDDSKYIKPSMDKSRYVIQKEPEPKKEEPEYSKKKVMERAAELTKEDLLSSLLNSSTKDVKKMNKRLKAQTASSSDNEVNDEVYGDDSDDVIDEVYDDDNNDDNDENAVDDGLYDDYEMNDEEDEGNEDDDFDNDEDLDEDN